MVLTRKSTSWKEKAFPWVSWVLVDAMSIMFLFGWDYSFCILTMTKNEQN